MNQFVQIKQDNHRIQEKGSVNPALRLWRILLIVVLFLFGGLWITVRVFLAPMQRSALTSPSKPDQPVNIQPTSVVTEALGHPRLFLNAEDIPDLQARAATSHQVIWKPIEDFATSQLATSPPGSAPAEGDLDSYRNYGNELIPYAFVCVVKNDASFCDLAKRYLLTYATWSQWGEGNQRDLGHAHMLLGNSIAYDWIYNRLTPEERQTVRESLATWAQKMYEASSAEHKDQSWNNFWRKSYVQNHHWINNSALGMAGLALLGEDERAQTWIDQASQEMAKVQYLLNGIEDGSWHEGIHYQSYGLTLSLPFLINLREIQGVDLFPHSYLRNYPTWRAYNSIPNSDQFLMSFGDFEWWWGTSIYSRVLLRFAASEYRDPWAEWAAGQQDAGGGRAANIWSTPWYVLEFLSYDPDIRAQSPGIQETWHIFPDLEGVVWRTGWGDDSLVFGLKTGAYAGRFAFQTFTQESYPWPAPCSVTDCQLNIGHDHSDANTFYLSRSGQWLAPESEGVSKIDTSFHNTLLVDGQGQYRPPADHFGRYPEEFENSDGFIEKTFNVPGMDYVAADATRPYKNIAGIEDYTRHVLFLRPDTLLMVDRIEADAQHQYEWVAHFGEGVTLEGNWVRGDAGGGQILGVQVVSPQPFQAITGDDGKPFVHIQPVEPVEDLRFIHLLLPATGDSWPARPEATLLDDNGEVVLVRVQARDGSDRIEDVLLDYASAGSDIFIGPYETDGQVGLVAKGQDGSMQKLLLFGGSFLKDNQAGQELVTGLQEQKFFSAVYFGRSVSLHGEIHPGITLYAPGVDRVFAGGASWPFTRSGDYITLQEPIFFYIPFISNER